MINYTTYSRQCLVVFRLFQAYFIDFTLVINMLTLSAVLIFSIVNPFKLYVRKKKYYVLLLLS